MSAVVKESTIPEFVPAFWTVVEVLMITAIELIQSVQNVLRSVGVYDIQKNGEAHSMRCIYELFEVLGGSIARARSKEACHLIAECYALKVSKEMCTGKKNTDKRNKHAP